MQTPIMNIADGVLSDGLAVSLLANPSKEVWIAIRTDGVPDADPANPSVVGDGTRGNPWDGSTAIKLDAILNQLVTQTNATIHLGPGLFRTGGGRGSVGAGGYDKWTPRSGWRIIGSGQYQTTLLLTPYGEKVASGLSAYWIAHSAETYLNGFEISDLTLDCGVDDHPMPPGARYGWPQTSGAGVWLGGRNNVIKRVRFVNFGTRAPGNVAR